MSHFKLRPMKILWAKYLRTHLSQAHEILQAVWNQGVDDLIKFLLALCSFSSELAPVLELFPF